MPWCEFYTKEDPRTDIVDENDIKCELSPD